MSKSLDKALSAAELRHIDIERDKYIVLSDQHLGDGEQSDDFRGNRMVYAKALREYFEQGFQLILLGDGEELWECNFPAVKSTYAEIFEVYHQFAVAHRLHRLYGNHDIFWRNAKYVRKFLPDRNPPPVIHEALLLKATEGSIFLTHGHQGEFFSDCLWPVSRLIVRYIWRPLQNLFGWNTRAAENIKKRSKRENEYYQWAKKHRVLFIAGHTHRAMFGSSSKLDRLRRDLAQLEKESASPARTPDALDVDTRMVRTKQQEIQDALAKDFRGVEELRFESEQIAVPCYFNSGCCSYDDGLTALEINGGTIRLVKWDQHTEQSTVYEEDSLRDLFSRINAS